MTLELLISDGHRLTGRTAVRPDAADVEYEGPALFAEARVPIDGYYA